MTPLRWALESSRPQAATWGHSQFWFGGTAFKTSSGLDKGPSLLCLSWRPARCVEGWWGGGGVPDGDCLGARVPPTGTAQGQTSLTSSEEGAVCG